MARRESGRRAARVSRVPEDGEWGDLEGCLSPAWVGTEENCLLQSYGLQGRDLLLFTVIIIFKRQKDLNHRFFFLKKKPTKKPKTPKQQTQNFIIKSSGVPLRVSKAMAKPSRDSVSKILRAGVRA